MTRVGSIVTVGTFDGVHRGHQSILKRVVLDSKRLNLSPIAVTFTIPPRLYFKPSLEPYLLSMGDEKKELLERAGIRLCVFLEFNRALSKISASDFFNRFIVRKWNAKKVIVGYNFCFGENREGNIDFLKTEGKKFGISIEIAPPLKRGSRPISSGRVREALLKGDLQKANELLGHPYFAIGKVVLGSQLGIRLGFPTANLKVNPMKILPEGVFAVRVKVPGRKNKMDGMCNIGVRPTLGSSGNSKKHFEVHLFNFKGNLYGKTLTVSFLKKLRAEIKFKNLSELKEQIEKDRLRALKILN